jgi:hypothetical protein
MTVSLQTIQDECNRVAGGCRISWIAKKPNEMMNENVYRLPGITYKDGLKELHPQFLLSCPSTIRISILDSRIDNSSDVCAVINDDDPPNPVLSVFLPTLELNGSTIKWTFHKDTFHQFMIHEFLHLCGDSPTQREDVVDGIIRHNIVAFNAIEPLLG